MTWTKAGAHGAMGLRHLLSLVLAVALAVLPPPCAAVEVQRGASSSPIVTDPAEVEVLRAVRDGITNAVEWLPHWADEFDPCGPLGWTPEIICNISDSGAATVTSITCGSAILTPFALPTPPRSSPPCSSLRAGLVGSLSPAVLRLPNLESLVLGQVSFNATALLPIINGLTQLKQLALMSTALNYRASQLALANMTRLQDLCAAEPVSCTAEPVSCAAEPVSCAAEHVICAAEPVSCAAEHVICAAEPVICAAEPVSYTAEPRVGLSGRLSDLHLPLMPSLLRIDLSTNSLSGSIPPALVASPALVNLILFGNELEGGLPDNFTTATSLQHIDLQSNKLTGSIPQSIETTPSLYYIDLSSNGLTGEIPQIYKECSFVELSPFLNLSSNGLTGYLPGSIGEYSLRNVKHFVLDVSHNKLEGDIPQQLMLSQSTLLLDGNAGFCNHPGYPPCPARAPVAVDSTTSGDSSNDSQQQQQQQQPPSSGLSPAAVAGIATAAVAGVAALVLAALVLVHIRRADGERREEEQGLKGKGDPSDSVSLWLPDSGVGGKKGASGKWTSADSGGKSKVFSEKAKKAAAARLEGSLLFCLDELIAATNGFHPTALLGRGGFGHVYHGVLPALDEGEEGEAVAIKVLHWEEGDAGTGGQGEREYETEVDLLSLVRHRHLVRLVGFCSEGQHRMLVYEYMPRGSLAQHLHGGQEARLPWSARVRIALGVARGLAYLHEGCVPRIVHRDIKPSNVLLDANMEARIADFGLAKMLHDHERDVATRVQGTWGYVAPEYLAGAAVSEKVDVYAFGVLLLELVTGRSPLGDSKLVTWAEEVVAKGELGALVDPLLFRDYNEGELRGLVHIIFLCLHHHPDDRPAMSHVVQLLEGEAAAQAAGGQITLPHIAVSLPQSTLPHMSPPQI
ncbi:unnamed protein product [Closterium sp. NIES-65]|nr:unnamed protein product [Closterium sp. NIES-65]